jgi:hypothetical protein
MASLGVQAATLSVVAPATAAPGSSFDAQIFIDDVPFNVSTEGFGGFEFDLTFSNPDLTATALVSALIFGLDTFPIDNDISVPGVATLAETTIGSGLNISTPTLLATVTFDVSSGATLGLSDLVFDNVILSDGFGVDIPGVQLVNDQVNITNGSSGVPVPGTLWLMGLAMLGFRAQRRRARGAMPE